MNKAASLNYLKVACFELKSAWLVLSAFILNGSAKVGNTFCRTCCAPSLSIEGVRPRIVYFAIVVIFNLHRGRI